MFHLNSRKSSKFAAVCCEYSQLMKFITRSMVRKESPKTVAIAKLNRKGRVNEIQNPERMMKVYLYTIIPGRLWKRLS